MDVGPNAEQIRYWNETSGPKWVALQESLDAQIDSLGRRAMQRLAPSAGESVVDIGCGCGTTSLQLASLVHPDGRVLGVDVSEVMLERARQVARQHGVSHVRFEAADAQTKLFPTASFDAAYSRFGVMFFADPAAAFANIRSALRPQGRVAFVCWRALAENPWMLLPMMAAAQQMQFPPPAPDAPGPFAFADSDRVNKILSAAGFREVSIEPTNEMLSLGGKITLDRAVEFLLQMGPTGSALREVGNEVRYRVTAAVREAIESYATPDGVKMDSAVWIVSARNQS